MLVVGAVEQGVAPDMRTLRTSQAVIMESAQYQKRTQQSVHWTLGIPRHFQAFCWLRIFPAPEHCPRPPQRQ